MIAIALFAAAVSHSTIWYRPSPLQMRVDRSFSDIPIDTPLVIARLRLKEDRLNGCTQDAECDWTDRNGVRHNFWGDGPNRLYLVTKTVRAADFAFKSIPALDIGRARDRPMVMREAERFLGSSYRFTCDAPTGQARCSITLDPGWLTIDFDARGQLVEIRFDGYDPK